MLGRNAHSTVDGQLCAIRKCQRTIFRRCDTAIRYTIGRTGVCHTNTLRLSSVHSVGGIERNEQGYAGRNGISTGGQSAAVHQDNCLVGCGSSSCRSRSVQVIKQIASANCIIVNLAHAQKATAGRFLGCCTNCEPGCAAIFSKGWLHSHIRSRLQRKAGTGRKDLAVSGIDPAQESSTAVGRCNQCQAISQRCFHAIAGGHSRTTCGNATKGAIVIDSNTGRIRCYNQTDIAELQGSSCVGHAVIGNDLNCQRSTSIQHNRICAGSRRSCTGNLESIVSRRNIIKR